MSTNVANLDNLAAAIAVSSPKIRKYAMAQAAATQSQELNLSILGDLMSAFELAVGMGGFYPVSAAVFYVDPVNGVDSNDGLTPTTAYQTIQAAYDDLPDTSGTNQGGGTLILLPGIYDVGAGFVGNGIKKHAVITSVSGYHPWFIGVAHGGDTPLSYPVITSTSATALFQLGSATGGLQEGWVFLGLSFDMTDPDVIYGIDAPDVNYGHVRNCAFQALDVSEKYGIRTRIDNTTDASWWTVRNCYTQGMGLCKLGTGGNSNMHVVDDNIINPGTNSFGVLLTGNDRSVVRDNNIEGTSAAAIKLVQCTRCTLNGNAGEGSFTTAYIWLDANSTENTVSSPGSNDTAVHILDENTGPINYFPTNKAFVINNFTANRTLAYSDMGTIMRMNVGSANTLTIPPISSVRFPAGATIYVNQRGAGQTTLTPGSGVTIRSSGGKLKLIGQYAGCVLQHMGGDEWQAWGDLTT